MNRIHLLPMGPVDAETLATIETAIGNAYGLSVATMETAGLPEFAYDGSRHQFNSEVILRRIGPEASASAFRILAVTEVDLFIPMLTFVYGQAQLRGKASVVSTARMRQEFYGLPESRSLMLKRVAKESVHELGHTFGLTHCLDRSCPMSVSVTIAQIDAKGEALCGDCLLLWNHSFSLNVRT